MSDQDGSVSAPDVDVVPTATFVIDTEPKFANRAGVHGYRSQAIGASTIHSADEVSGASEERFFVTVQWRVRFCSCNRTANPSTLTDAASESPGRTFALIGYAMYGRTSNQAKYSGRPRASQFALVPICSSPGSLPTNPPSPTQIAEAVFFAAAPQLTGLPPLAVHAREHQRGPARRGRRVPGPVRTTHLHRICNRGLRGEGGTENRRCDDGETDSAHGATLARGAKRALAVSLNWFVG